MHLLHVQTRELKEFAGVQPPPYAILSHRWGLEELNFQDVRSNCINRRLQGYQKLLGACHVATKCDVDYLWIDTCCIDKKSSAELSEAINSMYSWYEKAEICLAYLEDVDQDLDIDDSLTNSVWFTRSWTLQELLAPRQVDFYNVNWERIGDRGSKAEVIRARTGIPDYILAKECKLWECGIAERMSWASDRQATRPEDVAYSLMGIFDVNMPLLYGESIKHSSDFKERSSDVLVNQRSYFGGSTAQLQTYWQAVPLTFKISSNKAYTADNNTFRSA